tara:strand:- start:1348 stop:2064 length:717 start_codon:yes stop_codon:yes gene_type:complete
MSFLVNKRRRDLSDVKEGKLSFIQEGNDLYLYTRNNAKLFKTKFSQLEADDRITEKEEATKILRKKSQELVKAFMINIAGGMRVTNATKWWWRANDDSMMQENNDTGLAFERFARLPFIAPRDCVVTHASLAWNHDQSNWNSIQHDWKAQIVRGIASGSSGGSTTLLHTINGCVVSDNSFNSGTHYFTDFPVLAVAKGSAFSEVKLNAGDGIRLIYKRGVHLSTGNVNFNLYIAGEYL